MVHTFLFRRVLVGALVMVVSGAVASGQRPAAGPVTILVDFNATGVDGKPLTDLTPADVTIRLGGKPRTIQSLTLKTVDGGGAAPAAGTPAGTPAVAASTGPAPFATNEPKAAGSSGAPGSGSGRIVQILIDVESLRAGTEQAIKDSLEKLLSGLGPSDRVGLSYAPRDTAQVGLGPVANVRTALAGLRGQRPPKVSDAEFICRSSYTLKLFRAMLEAQAGSETPMAFVFVAGTLSLTGREKDSVSGTCEVLPDDYRGAGTAAANARANVYVLQGDPGVLGRDSGLEQLAGATGAGLVMNVTNEAFAPRVIGDASAYWVATLAPDPADRPGPPQRLEIKVAKEGATVRARNEIGIGSRAGAATAGSGPAKPAGPMSPRDMARAPQNQTFTDLQLRTTVYASRGTAEKMTALVLTEAVDPAAKITALSVGYFDQNGQGGVVAAKDEQLKATTVAMPMALGSGQYRIRVAATDASGKGGAVDIPVNTALIPAGPFKISNGMMFLAVTESGTKPRMIFSDEPAIQVMFEFYGMPAADAKMKVGFELIVSPTEKPQTFRPIGMMPTNEPDKFQIFGEIPIAKLPPGDYVIHGIVHQEGQTEGRVTRSFRKIAK